jgi:hypothetical protein
MPRDSKGRFKAKIEEQGFSEMNEGYTPKK